MVIICSVKDCGSEAFPNSGLSFHRLPKDANVRVQWLDSLGDQIRSTTKYPFVCSKHFNKNDYVSSMRPTLKRSAVPYVVPSAKRIRLLSEITLQDPSTSSQESHIDVLELHAKLVDCGTQTVSLPCPKEEELRKRVKNISQKLVRRDVNIKNMNNLMEILKKKCENFNEVDLVIKNNFQDIHKHFNENKSSKTVRYSDQLKQFALTLYFYSKPAYNLLRNHIALPHPVTLRKILTTTECKVGFLKEAFEYLQSLSTTGNQNIEDVALLFDSMSITSDEVFDKHRGIYVGHVDFGGILQPDRNVLATEVLMFQVVSLKKRMKFPIAYFLTDKMTAYVQAELLMVAIRMLSEVDINVRSLTCDGTVTNKSTYEILGCHLSMPDMITYFKHPTKDHQKVYCIFDPPHMIKLARNVFAETKLSSAKGDIDFSYVKELHSLQGEEGLHLANKLCNAHVNFFQKKMNVKLATQLLSRSVADAIDFLAKTGHPKFVGSEATVEYIRMLDRVFDLMNCKDPRGTGFKTPLSLANKDVWEKVLFDTRQYLCSLNVCGESILKHRRKMPALGLVVNTFSFHDLALDLLNQSEYRYFLPYKCSQDHLEMLFSCIRARGGSNDNPNALQFRYILRTLLFKNSIKPSIHANCSDESFELSPIVEFRSKKRCLLSDDVNDIGMEEQQIKALFDNLQNVVVSEFKLNILYYIAGAIVNNLLKKINCEYCHMSLLTNKKENDHSYSVDLSNFSAFTTFVDRGRLKYVSNFPFEIIIFAEKLFNLAVSTESLKNINRNKLMILTTQHFTSILHTFKLNHPLQCFKVEDNHEMQLLKGVASKFFNLRMAHHSKTQSVRNLGRKIGLRQKLHKTILFSNV